MKLTIRKKLLITSIAPLLLLATVVIIFTSTAVRTALKNEIKDSLRATAVATLAAYDQNVGEYLLSANGDVWKGSYNISKSESLVDKIKADSNMDVTFFYGSTRIMTSALDENGNRILGSPAGNIIIETVLKKGEEYFSETVSLDGIMNYGYYIPVYQKGSTTNPIGMIFVGVNKAEKDTLIWQIINILVISVLIVILIGIFFCILFATNLANALRRSIHSVQNVADGDLNTIIDTKACKRQDEIGDLSKAILRLQDSMRTMICKLKEHSHSLRDASCDLDSVAGETILNLNKVEHAVEMITSGASEQVSSTKEATVHVSHMGQAIEEAAKELENLNQNATVMRQSGEKASSTIQSLLTVNAQVQKAIDLISNQTSHTNHSAQKIRQATELITSIAEETSLLSLNASIEAAHAGNAGRGFAIVADQIQQLAAQSNEAVGTIDQIVSELLSASEQMVNTMKEVTEIVGNQNQSISITESTVTEVQHGIEASLNSMNVISVRTKELDEARVGVMDIMSALSDIASQNATSTQETSAATSEVTDCFQQVTNSSEHLKQVADELVKSMGNFRI